MDQETLTSQRILTTNFGGKKIVVNIKTSLIVLLTEAKAWHIGLRGMNEKIDTIAHARMKGASGIRKGF